MNLKSMEVSIPASIATNITLSWGRGLGEGQG
jgi:hypothetical protein